MIALTHFLKGMRQSASLPKMILFLYCVNLVLAFCLAVPMFHALQESFGSSLVGERMAQEFDYLWWEEFRDQGVFLRISANSAAAAASCGCFGPPPGRLARSPPSRLLSALLLALAFALA